MNKRIKVLYLMSHLQNLAPVTVLYDIVHHLDRKIFEPVICTFYDERAGSRIDDFRALGISVIQMHSSHKKFLTQPGRLQKIVDNLQPDVIHSNSVMTDMVAYRIQRKVPLVLTLHSFINEDLIMQYGKLVGGLMCHMEKNAIRDADCVVTCSKTLKGKYENCIPRKYVAIQNGIETAGWQQHVKSQETLRKELGILLGKYVFLSTGLLKKRKDPLTIVKAYKQIENENTCLVMLGDGEYEEAVKQACGADSSILLPGRVSNVKDYLYACDTLISASKSEGLPLAIIEAACTGIPMILSDIPQHREVMEQEESKVSFFPVGDVVALTKNMNLAVHELRTRINYQVDPFTASYMSQNYQKQYLKLLSDIKR